MIKVLTFPQLNMLIVIRYHLCYAYITARQSPWRISRCDKDVTFAPDIRFHISLVCSYVCVCDYSRDCPPVTKKQPSIM